MKKLILLLALASCADPNTSEVASPSINLNAMWTWHEISAGFNGADGVDIVVDGSGNTHMGVGWEQSSVVTDSVYTTSWITTNVGSNSSVEDVKIGDIDGQGVLDEVSFSQGNKVKIHWGETGLVDTVVDAATNDQQWLAGVLADVDGDGDLDIITGGRRQAYPPAYVKWYENPGGTNARNHVNWGANQEHVITVTGLTMEIIAFDIDADSDMDIVFSDRDPYWTGVGQSSDQYRWTRWLEQTSTGWINHQISHRVNLGEPKMLGLHDMDGDGDLDVLDGGSNTNGQNHLYIETADTGWTQWSSTEVTLPSGIGNYHDVESADVDSDGDLDFVVTCSEAYSAGVSGVFWLANDGIGGYARGEISGDDGDKWDNVVLRDMDGDGDLDVVSTEQHETLPPSNNTQAGHGGGLGLGWYENPVQ